MNYDLLITNVVIADGTGGPLFSGQVAVQGGRIAAVYHGTPLFASDADRVVDGGGKLLTPGFVDVHTHCENAILRDPVAAHKLAQGITTLITGHCGESVYPTGTFADLDHYRAACQQQGLGVNLVSMTGHGNLRESVLGAGNVACDLEGLSAMAAVLERQLDQGAAGLSSGLEYAPGMYADSNELAALVDVCAARDRVYSTHMRCEGSRLLEAANEAITVAQHTGCRTVLSHLKACGKPNHGKVRTVLTMMDSANVQGCDVYADAYPYPAASTGLSIVLPQWTLDNGMEQLPALLASPEARAEIHRWFTLGTDVWENRSIVTGWENISIAFAEHPAIVPLIGKNMAEIAQLRQQDPVDALMDLLQLEGKDIPGILRSACEEDLRTAYAHPRVMVCSDSTDVAGGRPHPRLYGSHSRYLCHYADLHDDFAVASAVRRMTGLPAQVYNLSEIGAVAVGKRADLALWDPAAVRDLATFEDPYQLSQGMEAVWVGGQLAWDRDHATGTLSGAFLTL
jgi:N-acyl-D-aspartate/D-glutamate deacylase